MTKLITGAGACAVAGACMLFIQRGVIDKIGNRDTDILSTIGHKDTDTKKLNGTPFCAEHCSY